MDALSEILNSIRLKSSVYFRSDFSSPWGMKIDQSDFAQFHLVVRGKCLLKYDPDQPTIELSTGDIVVFPGGSSHWIADDIKSIRVYGRDVVKAHRDNKSIFSGEGNKTTLVCGHFEYDRTLDHPFITSLPKLIYIPDKDPREMNWLETAVSVMIQETGSGKAGSNAVVTRMAEVLFIHILRSYMMQENIPDNFFAALKDKQISLALGLIHDNPQKAWRLVNIAKEIGMSRSAFALRFKSTVGITPMDYITRWRMIKAKELLVNKHIPIIEIAERVGYLSEASFIRAFRRQFKVNPGAMRKIMHEKN